jgi:spermidine synthase
MDAEEYARQATQRFSLIIIDLFIDNEVPEQFTRLPFLEDCRRILSTTGTIVFNFIASNSSQGESYKLLENNLEATGFKYKELRLFSTNRVLIISLP